MTKQGKMYSRREKAAAIMVGTALIGAPMLFDASHVAFATDEPAKSIDKIGNLIVPLNGTVLDRNLKSIYGASNAVNFTVTSSNQDIATNEPGFSAQGLLKIHPSHVGTASFTVSYLLNGESYQDKFDVTVVDDETVERNFNIGDVVKKSMLTSSQTDAAELLRGIGPMNSTGNMDGNTPPVLNSNNPFHDFNLEINTFTYLGDIRSFFSDGEDAITTEVFENTDNTESTEDDSVASLEKDGDSWVIHSRKVGTTAFTVVATDLHGGVTTKSFNVVVHGNTAPQLKMYNPVVKHIANPNYELNLSVNAALDLNEIFFDFSPKLYDVEVGYSYQSGNVTKTVRLDSNLLTNEGLKSQLSKTPQPPNGGSPFHISKLVAIDSTEVALFTTLDQVDINLGSTNYNAIPSSISIFESNAAGAGTFTVDLAKQHWLDENKALVEVQPEAPEVTNVLSSFNSVQPDLPITFTAGNIPTVSSKKFHVFSQSTPNIWFLNDLTANILSTSPNSTINLTSLYASNSGMDWLNMYDHFYDYASVSLNNSVSEVVYSSYTTGNSTFLEVQLRESTYLTNDKLVLTFDPDANSLNQGSRVYTIPFVRPNYAN